jgi:hypothetical protein
METGRWYGTLTHNTHSKKLLDAREQRDNDWRTRGGLEKVGDKDSEPS